MNTPRNLDSDLTYIELLRQITAFCQDNSQYTSREEVKAIIIQALNLNKSLLRDHFLKMSAELTLRYQIEYKSQIFKENPLLLQDAPEVNLFKWITAQVRKDKHLSLSESVLTVLKIDQKWLDLVLEAAIHFPENPTIETFLSHLRLLCKGSYVHLLRLSELYSKRESNQLALEVAKECLKCVPKDFTVKKGLLIRLSKLGSQNEYDYLAQEMILASNPASDDYKIFGQVLIDSEKWSMLLLYAYRLIEHFRNTKVDDEVYYGHALAILAYAKLSKYKPIVAIYKEKWLASSRAFPYPLDLLEAAHQVNAFEIIQHLYKNISEEEIARNINEKRWEYLRLKAEILESKEQWPEAQKSWEELLKHDEKKLSYLYAASTNLLKQRKQSLLKQVEKYVHLLEQLTDCQKVSNGLRALVAFARDEYDRGIQIVIRNSLYLEKNHPIYNDVRQAFVNAVLNDRDSLTRYKDALSHCEDQLSFEDRMFVKYIQEIENSLNLRNLNEFLQFFGLTLRLPLSSGCLNHLVTLMEEGERLSLFPKENPRFDEYITEVENIRKLFLLKLVMEAENLLASITDISDHNRLKERIRSMDLTNAITILADLRAKA